MSYKYRRKFKSLAALLLLFFFFDNLLRAPIVKRSPLHPCFLADLKFSNDQASH